MKIAAIIAEYNPLHTGHLYHLTATREALCPDATVVVMSGNFCQRGDIAIAEKHERAIWAIHGGADIVLEIPPFYAVNCAEKFAEGAIKTLSCFNAPLTLSFGSESGDIAKILNYAAAGEESPAVSQKIKEGLDRGESYPSARAKALPDIALLPGDILATEYAKQANKYNFDLFAVKREGSGYNENKINQDFASALAIREHIFSGKLDNIRCFLPDFVQIDENNCNSNERLTDMMLYRLATADAPSLECLLEVSEGLENRILSAAASATDYASLTALIKSKRYTMARIKRILLYALFELSKDLAQSLYSAPPYAKVLAIRRGREDILSLLSAAPGGMYLSEREEVATPHSVSAALEFSRKVDGIYYAASKRVVQKNAVFVK